MATTKILAFAGATREASLNKKLLKAAVTAAREAGGEVTSIDLRDYPMPLYDGDIEASSGLPEPAKALKALMISHQGLLLACPEYNSSITAVLKNAIDWASRAVPGEGSLVAFTGKVAALVSASPGALGGLRGLVTVRSILSSIGMLVIPEQLAVSKANEAFDDAGRLKDPKQAASLVKVVTRLVTVTSKLNA